MANMTRRAFMQAMAALGALGVMPKSEAQAEAAPAIPAPDPDIVFGEGEYVIHGCSLTGFFCGGSIYDTAIWGHATFIIGDGGPVTLTFKHIRGQGAYLAAEAGDVRWSGPANEIAIEPDIKEYCLGVGYPVEFEPTPWNHVEVLVADAENFPALQLSMAQRG